MLAKDLGDSHARSISFRSDHDAKNVAVDCAQLQRRRLMEDPGVRTARAGKVAVAMAPTVARSPNEPGAKRLRGWRREQRARGRAEQNATEKKCHMKAPCYFA